MLFEYKGYSYEPWKDYEEDNVKIFHEVYATKDDVKVQSNDMPMSPYAEITHELFCMWIDCDMPSGKQMGLTGNAQVKDLKKYYWDYVDDLMDKEILGVL